MYPMDIEVKGYAFSECENFAIFYPNTFDEITDTFYRCKNIKMIIPESVKILTGGSLEEVVFYECENVTIVAAKGSYAEQYAKEHEITFECYEE